MPPGWGCLMDIYMTMALCQLDDGTFTVHMISWAQLTLRYLSQSLSIQSLEYTEHRTVETVPVGQDYTNDKLQCRQVSGRSIY